MTTQQEQVLRWFREFGIRNLVIGGQAMRALGIERRTHDLDLWIGRDSVTVEALTRLYQQKEEDQPAGGLDQPQLRITFGDCRHPDVDVINFIAGDLDFDACFNRAHHLALDGEPVVVISAADLLAIKKACAEIMDRDAANPEFELEKRALSANTAAKERPDIELLEKYLLIEGAGGR